MEAHSFGHWLRLKRKTLDLTRQGLAERVGCSAATIQKLEEEERRPSLQMAERLAVILEVPAQDQAAFLRFARGEGQRAPAGAAEDFPWRPVRLAASNLPAPVTPLIGRDAQVAEVCGLVRRPDLRLVTLVGPPGIGKTRLGIEAARALLGDFPDGVYFVALASLDEAALLAQTVAHALGLDGSRQESTEAQLFQSIGEKAPLIVLDNCEHLVDSVAALVRQLLAGCPRLCILATSRESLRIAGEWQYAVPALAAPDPSAVGQLDEALAFPAVDLFVRRAQAVRADFVLDAESVQAAAALCARLDGLPLGIELIAARTRLMSPHELLGRLNEQMLLVTDSLRADTWRQTTLNNAIRWSYDLLSGEEQALFAYLSVFAGGFSLDMAEALFAQRLRQRSVADQLTSLLDKSLIQRDPASAPEQQFGMLVVLQEFGRARLRESTEATAIRDAHLAYFLSLAEQGDQHVRGPQQVEWLQRLHRLRDNFRAALEWALTSQQTLTALQLVRKLHWFWLVRSDHSEARQWLGRVLDLPETAAHPALQAEVLAQLAHHSFLQVRPQAARPFAEQALAIARAHGDNHNTARALLMLGLALTGEKDFAAAEAALAESRVLFGQAQDEWSQAMAVLALGWAAAQQKNWLASLTLMEEALAVYRRLDDRYLSCVLLNGIGFAHLKQDRLRQAEAALQSAIGFAQQLDSKYEIAGALFRLGDAAQAEQQWARAVQLYAAAKAAYERLGAWPHENEYVLDDYLAPCRAALDEATLAAAWEAGRAMTIDEAVAYATAPTQA